MRLRNFIDKIIALFRRKPKTTVIVTPTSKKFVMPNVPDRGKEDPHTKMRRKMADRSRKINRGLR